MPKTNFSERHRQQYGTSVKWSKRTLEQLKLYVAATKAKDAAHAMIQASGLEDSPLHVGDTIRTAKGKVGRITKVWIAVDRDGDLELQARAYPIKKNGETSSVGEMPLWPWSERWEVIEKAPR